MWIIMQLITIVIACQGVEVTPKHLRMPLANVSQFLIISTFSFNFYAHSRLSLQGQPDNQLIKPFPCSQLFSRN